MWREALELTGVSDGELAAVTMSRISQHVSIFHSWFEISD
jgi:hypothetical protein